MYLYQPTLVNTYAIALFAQQGAIMAQNAAFISGTDIGNYVRMSKRQKNIRGGK